jgi:hypothetical protein
MLKAIDEQFKDETQKIRHVNNVWTWQRVPAAVLW